MNLRKTILLSIIITFSTVILAQKSTIYTYPLKDFDHALGLYHNKDYRASQELFLKIRNQFDDNSEKKAIADYYIAFSALHLGDRKGEKLMQDFVENYPTSIKRNDAFREVSEYYYDYGKYADALKWFKYVDTKSLTNRQEEDFNFKYGYALFKTGNYKKAKNYFAQLLDSKKYGTQAKYYNGYIAYQQDDYDNADRYLDQVNDTNLSKDIPYFKANIKFKLGKFQEALDLAVPYFDKANRKQKSDVAKIIGESYFNLGQYDKAIPYLLQYRGKRNKWNNTDYYQLGYAYYKQGDYDNAIKWFNKIIAGKNAVSQNASYHIAECYLKTNKKQEALNAFKKASEMDYDNEIKKNAWLNYAKLSYEIGNPYKSVPDVLNEYLEKYPKTESKEEINDLLVSSYVTSNDYKGALKLLRKKNDKKSKEILQKVAFYRAIQLFKDGNYNDAIPLFELSIKENHDPKFTARAMYWKGESEYILNKFDKAKQSFTEFLSLPQANETNEFNDAYYGLAYSYLKKKEYEKAKYNFNNFIQTNSKSKSNLNDAYLRLGDMYFITRDYWKAMDAYNEAIKKGAKSIDYARFQKAISYGFVGKNDKKIQSLNEFLQLHKHSKLRDEAYFNLGNAYKKAKQYKKALASYQKIIDNHKKSKLVPKALLKQGLIYFNNNQGEKALVKYKKLVRDYPNTPEARQAVNNAKQIYINLGRVDEYADWIQNVDFVEVSDAELDNTMYESAEIQYQQNNKSKAISNFKKYLNRFPNGLHALQAHFYLAEIFYSDNKLHLAKPHYENIINKESNEFTEQALTRLSQILLKDKKWQEAIPVLKRLEEEAKSEQNILYAQSNLMKGYYELENYLNAVTYAEKILENPSVDNQVKTDAKIIIARSAIKTGDLEKARTAYQDVNQTATGRLKAEAIYYDAYFKNNDGDYKNSNKSIQELASKYSNYKIWSVKGLVIMGKNFYGLDDAYQATLVLESVIKNFKDKPEHKEAVDEAKKILKQIKKEQSKTNASVVPD
jgi:tetratricopeptide (TPR) repeat protein